MAIAQLSVEDKYRLYEESVQCQQADIEFINTEFKRHRKRRPHFLREDFSGTGLLACDWIRQGASHKALAVDIDEDPVSYGRRFHYSKLTRDEQRRIKYVLGSVLNPPSAKVDVTVALNFSYFFLKTRRELLKYFKLTHKTLVDDGIFFLDIFGGTECHTPHEEETVFENHTYYWNLDRYNPITNECTYYIHFKKHDERRRYNKVFSCDLRMWALPEVVDVLKEAGFSKVLTYWDDGEENEEQLYRPVSRAQNCPSWVCYIVALK